MIVKTEVGMKDVPITQVTKENYIVPENEKNLFHCSIEVRQFDKNTGARISVPRIQKFGVKTFLGGVYETLKRQGYTIDILHDPSAYLAELEAKKEEAGMRLKQAAEEAKAEAEKKQQEAFELAVQKEVEARLAAMKENNSADSSQEGEEGEGKESEGAQETEKKKPGRKAR